MTDEHEDRDIAVNRALRQLHTCDCTRLGERQPLCKACRAALVVLARETWL